VSRIGFYGRGTQRRKIPFVCCAGVSPVREREEGRGEVLEPSPQPSPIRMGRVSDVSSAGWQEEEKTWSPHPSPLPSDPPTWEREEEKR